MANLRDIFLIVAGAAFGAFAMIGFNQLSQCNAQIDELNQLCRVQMNELKEIASTTEFGKIIEIITEWSLAEILKYTFICVMGSILTYMFALMAVLNFREIRRNEGRRGR